MLDICGAKADWVMRDHITEEVGSSTPRASVHLAWHTSSAIATARPADEEALRSLPGVGDVKLVRFGATFLRAVEDHEGVHPVRVGEVAGC